VINDSVYFVKSTLILLLGLFFCMKVVTLSKKV